MASGQLSGPAPLLGPAPSDLLSLSSGPSASRTGGERPFLHPSSARVNHTAVSALKFLVPVALVAGGIFLAYKNPSVISSAAGTVGSVVGSVVSAVGSVANSAVSAVGSVAGSAVSVVGSVAGRVTSVVFSAVASVFGAVAGVAGAVVSSPRNLVIGGGLLAGGILTYAALTHKKASSESDEAKEVAANAAAKKDAVERELAANPSSGSAGAGGHVV